MKIIPQHPLIRIMLMLMIIYCILSYIQINIIQKEYDYERMKQDINKTKKKEELQKYVGQIDNIAKSRFYVLIGAFVIFFITYVLYKVKTEKSESIAIMFAIILSLSGKMIEKLGISNCLNVPIIDPKGLPGNVLLFDMFYTNFFAYFLDFVYAFVAVQIVTNTNIIGLLKSKKLSEMMIKNVSLFTKDGIRIKNILRFLIYLVVIVIFWNWGSIVRPKLNLLIHRYLGIPVIDKENLELENKSEDDQGLITTISSIGIISASVVEGLIFTGLLYPMRKFFLYSLNYDKEFDESRIMVYIKFIYLVLLIPIFIILMTKYTLSSDDPNLYKYPKMISIMLGFYIFIPLVLFMMESLLNIPIRELFQKNKTIFMGLYLMIPIIISIIMTITEKNCISYIEDNPEKEKEIEKYMSETATGDCGKENDKYKIIVLIVTCVLMVFAMVPFLSVHKIQLINGLIYLCIITGVIKFIYGFQDNYSSYNILNPMRRSDESEYVDLDSAESIQSSMLFILISICVLILFRKFH